MLILNCPACNAQNKLPSLEEMLKLKGDKICPFIHFEDCCEQKKLKIILKKNNGISTEFVDH